jgi:hypothetical protein
MAAVRDFFQYDGTKWLESALSLARQECLYARVHGTTAVGDFFRYDGTKMVGECPLNWYRRNAYTGEWTV